jgi:hypothetical protein
MHTWDTLNPLILIYMAMMHLSVFPPVIPPSQTVVVGKHVRKFIFLFQAACLVTLKTLILNGKINVNWDLLFVVQEVDWWKPTHGKTVYYMISRRVKN